MPVDLPGYYFDNKRNRYFPVSFRSGLGQGQSTHVVQKETLKHKFGCGPGRSVEVGVLQLLHRREVGGNSGVGSSWSTSAFQRKYVELQASQPRVWSYRGLSANASGAIEHFHTNIETCEGLKEASLLIWGGTNAEFGVCEILQSKIAKGRNDAFSPCQVLTSQESNAEVKRSPHLLPTRNLVIFMSMVTGIRRYGRAEDAHHDGVILTTLGSEVEGGALYLLKQSQQQDGCWQTGQQLPFNIVRSAVTDCSVWTTACSGSTKATLGTSKGAALVDLERSMLTWLFHSRSDVLSQQCDASGNIVLCGFRNGSISTIDVRVSSHRRRMMPLIQTRQEPSILNRNQQNTFLPPRVHTDSPLKIMHDVGKKDHRIHLEEGASSYSKTMKMESSICSLVLLHSDETYLLASAMNGHIHLWDRRLVEKGPVLLYEGNRNSHSMLQLGIDPLETILASGGEDRTVRIWSVRSGKLLQSITGLPSVAHTFSSPTELGNINLHGWNSSLKELTRKRNHVWGMWIGSNSEVMYMHGATTPVF